MKNKKMISVAVIGLFVFSMFATVLMAFALSGPYITVSPSSVKVGQTVTVKGYGFTGGEIVGICLDVVDDYHKLGNVTVNTAGRFTFKFVMQASYSGTHRIIVAPGIYTADFTLGYTNPLDERLIDLIKGLTIDVGDIEAKLDTILGTLGTAPYGSTGTIWRDINRIWGLLGGGLGGQNYTGTITTDGTRQDIVWFAAPGHPVKCSIWLDTRNMIAGDTILVEVDLYIPNGPRLYSLVTYTGAQAEDAKLIVNQLPVAYYMWVTIRQTAGAPDKFTYLWISEEV